MSGYRLRAEGALLVLQVGVWVEPDQYSYGSGKNVWRDATLEDIPVHDLFQPPQVVREYNAGPDPEWRP